MRADRHRTCRPTRDRLRSVAVAGASWVVVSCLVLACAEPDPRTSIVLIVADTLRADAVSAYGAVEGTTPHLDALAAEGIRYTRAYAPSSWTIPSHASLLTGQGIDRHHVGVRGRLTLPEEFVTLAERFREAGYETAAFSENMLVSDVFGLLQGFRYRRVTRLFKKSEGLAANVLWVVEPELHIPEWLESRPHDKPFFLFVNLFDAHTPYSVREENPWVPADASPEEMRRYAEKPESRLCAAAPPQRDLDVLRGLYLGDVAETDRKINQILEDVARLGGASKIITIVTADHGELFGERGLLGHEFNLRQGALHVPLVVHGLDAPPAVVETPVTLVDVSASILDWAGLERGPELDGQSLPVAGPGTTEQDRPISSVYSDGFVIDPGEWEGLVGFLDKDVPRSECGPDDKVFGAMASMIDYPFKYQWFERYEPELYDLSWDPDEKSDQALHQPEVVARLHARFREFLDAAWLTREPDEAVTGVSREEAEALEALGYAD